MTRYLITAPAGLRDLVREQARTADVAPWVRAALWCWGHIDEHGHARAYPGQLRAVLGLSTADDVARAVRLAREHGLIDSCSTSGCLVVPGHAVAPCDARHRDPSS